MNFDDNDNCVQNANIYIIPPEERQNWVDLGASRKPPLISPDPVRKGGVLKQTTLIAFQRAAARPKRISMDKVTARKHPKILDQILDISDFGPSKSRGGVFWIGGGFLPQTTLICKKNPLI